MTKQTKKSMPHRFQKKLYRVLMVLMLASIGFAIFRIVTLDGQPIETRFGTRTIDDYVLIILQTIVGIVVIKLPEYLERKLKMVLPDLLKILYVSFLFCAIYLGEVHNFYMRIPFWDTILHALSGGMLAIIGFFIVQFMNRFERLDVRLSPGFVAFFAFCFAVTCGTLWEIYEFTADHILGTNMQKYMTYDLNLLIGHEALIDTMKDLIVDVLAALVISVTGYVTIKNRQETENISNANT